MFEPEMTRLERAWAELRWALDPGRPLLMTVRQRVRAAVCWMLLGALLAANAIAWYAHAYPGEVTAVDARLEDQSERFLVWSIGLKHRGVEVRCLLSVDRLKSADRHDAAFTVSC